MAKTARNVRVSDELWAAAKAKARAEYRTVTDVIVQALRDYTGPPGPAWATPERGQPAAEFEEREIERAATSPPQPDHPAFTAAPSRPRKPAADAGYRCPHAGVRVIGGYCTPCGTAVRSGGALPAGYVPPWAA